MQISHYAVEQVVKYGRNKKCLLGATMFIDSKNIKNILLMFIVKSILMTVGKTQDVSIQNRLKEH